MVLFIGSVYTSQASQCIGFNENKHATVIDTSISTKQTANKQFNQYCNNNISWKTWILSSFQSSGEHFLNLVELLSKQR